MQQGVGEGPSSLHWWTCFPSLPASGTERSRRQRWGLSNKAGALQPLALTQAPGNPPCLWMEGQEATMRHGGSSRPGPKHSP